MGRQKRDGRGRIAQLGEHLPYKQGVIGSSPIASTTSGRVVQLVRMPACHAGGRRFEPVPGRQYADVAQPAEQLICNQQVGGSIPSISSKFRRCKFIKKYLHLPDENHIIVIASFPVTQLPDDYIHKFRGIPEWPKGADCKSVSSAFDGSNPSPSTIVRKWLRGRASPCQGEGREFESRLPLHFCGCSSMVELQPSKLIA